MHSRGHSKQVLVAMTLAREIDPATDAPRQPVTGAHVLPAPAPGVSAPTDAGDSIGAVTSSCVSPMLGGTPVCLAHLKQGAAAPGTEVLVQAGTGVLWGRVQPTLRVWTRR